MFNPQIAPNSCFKLN